MSRAARRLPAVTNHRHVHASHATCIRAATYTVHDLPLRSLRCECSCSGVVGLDELRQWLVSGDHAAPARRCEASVRHAALLPERLEPMLLAQMRWEPPMVQRSITAMLRRAGLSPIDLMRAWGRASKSADDKPARWYFTAQDFTVCGHPSMERRPKHHPPTRDPTASRRAIMSRSS